MDVTCPQCGGQNSVPSGERLLTCVWCDATLFVDRGGAVSHYRVPRLQDRDEAERSLRRWMAGNETVKDLDSQARVTALVPLLFPVWMFRLRRRGGETVLVEPAAPTPIAELADLQVPAGKLQPYAAPEDDEGAESRTASDGATVTPATVPLETARGWLAAAEGAGGGDGEVVETALVHLPLWEATYEFGGSSYTALVDASTGKVMVAVFPVKAEAPYILVAVLGLLLFGAEGLVLLNPAIKLAAYAVTAVPLFLIAWWVTRSV